MTKSPKSASRVSALIDKLLSKRILSRLDDDQRADLGDDIELVRRLIGAQRTPRLAVVGPASVSLPGVVKMILGEAIDGNPTVKEHLGRRRWYDYSSSAGDLRMLDLRGTAGEDVPPKAVGREQPDLVLFLWPTGRQDAAEALIARLEATVRHAQKQWGEAPRTVAALLEGGADGVDLGAAESQLRRRLVASTIPNESFDVGVCSEEARLVALMVRRAPMEVRAQFAHLTWVRAAKREVADSVVRAAAGIAGAIGTVPIPVADIVPLTALQASMIAVVAQISGRPRTFGTAWEFALAMGLNVGAGLALRGVARTALRVVPVAGSFIAAGIASSATYGLGQSAVAYFIGEQQASSR